MTKAEMRVFIITLIAARLARAGARRDEALREVISVSSPGMSETAINDLVAMTPELPPGLYTKWAGMFADRLLETVPDEQLEELCRNSEESNAALMLLYSMFMESARMEKVIAEDLRAFASTDDADGEKTALLAAWLASGANATSH